MGEFKLDPSVSSTLKDLAQVKSFIGSVIGFLITPIGRRIS
jgi:hypothetical protein